MQPWFQTRIGAPPAHSGEGSLAAHFVENSARRLHFSSPKICGACAYPSSTGDRWGRKELCELPELAGDRVVGRLSDRTRPIPGGLEDRSRYLSTRLLGAAARLQVAGITIGLAGAVAKHAIVIGFLLPGFREGPAALLQLLAARADVDIPLGIIGEVGALECPIPTG